MLGSSLKLPLAVLQPRQLKNHLGFFFCTVATAAVVVAVAAVASAAAGDGATAWHCKLASTAPDSASTPAVVSSAATSRPPSSWLQLLLLSLAVTNWTALQSAARVETDVLVSDEGSYVGPVGAVRAVLLLLLLGSGPSLDKAKSLVGTVCRMLSLDAVSCN